MNSEKVKIDNPFACNRFHKKIYVINPKSIFRKIMPYACGDYMPAFTGLHTNPSDWIKKDSPKGCLFLVQERRLELPRN